MTKYISGEYLLIHLDIKPFELFHYVKEGHQPLDQFGRPIPPPDISAKLKELEKLQTELERIPKPQWLSLEEVKKYGSHPPSWVFGVFEEQERARPRREALSRKIDILKKDMENVIDISSWANYELPKDIRSAQWVINQLEGALFEIEQEAEKDSPKEEPTPQKEEKCGNFFHKEGALWHIGFEGKEKRIPHILGLQYIGYLLERPGKQISCGELYQAASGATPDNIMPEGIAISEGLNMGHIGMPASDYEAKQEYRKRYQKLADDLDEVEDNPEGEIIRKEIEKEMAEIEPHLMERAIPDKETKNQQSRITKALGRAYTAIQKEGMTNMAKHLRTEIKPGGYNLIYTGTLSWDITL